MTREVIQVIGTLLRSSNLSSLNRILINWRREMIYGRLIKIAKSLLLPPVVVERPCWACFEKLQHSVENWYFFTLCRFFARLLHKWSCSFSWPLFAFLRAVFLILEVAAFCLNTSSKDNRRLVSMSYFSFQVKLPIIAENCPACFEAPKVSQS